MARGKHDEVELVRLTKTRKCTDFFHRAAMKWDNVVLLQAVIALAFFAADFNAHEMKRRLHGLKIERDQGGEVDRKNKRFREYLLLKGGEILGQIWDQEEAERRFEERAERIRAANF